ncbi:hypothetical protein LOK49_LG12G00965 [Camellia lanceoleosa]|uniref:Uncharacterized protein n=1 Tax=Camellia lanceoleosa TaxID=1840588 RepID=A0ACC0FXK4_9ERIC|nr:hypothetical protein LOK49_LG12G00965 [Camellia lanceoleosa]
METASLSVPDLFPLLFPFLVKLLKNTPCLARWKVCKVGFFFRGPYSKGIDPDALKTSLAAARGALTSNKKLEESRHEKPSETEPDQLAEDVKPAPSPDGEVGTGGQTNGKKT